MTLPTAGLPPSTPTSTPPDRQPPASSYGSPQALYRPRPTLSALIRRFPTCYALIGTTSLVFLAQMAGAWLLGRGLTCSFGDVVCELGAKDVQAIAAGQLWRLVTPLFVHVGVWHLFINMYSLNALGPAVERFFGSPRTLVIYLLSGTGGVVFSLAFSNAPAVGASGAIFGLLGALGVFLFQHRATFGRAAEMQLQRVLLIALLNLALGLLPQIDKWGHFGGLLVGAALAWFLGPRMEVLSAPAEPTQLADRRPWREVWLSAVIAAGVIAALALAAIYSPFRG
ncbi:MAG TPA: rhomboid family intramembrane serine protease [Anaerolineales bacterium]|nr:rhomboid family intramembrane serine protease [Anaerolineales bacterium]